MLDLITQSLNDLDDPSQPWSKAIIGNLKQAFFFAGQKDVEHSFRKLLMTDHHIEQYRKLDPAQYEVLYWSAGGLRRILRPVTDPYTYWLATTDARERSVKRLMQELHGGSVKSIIEELVRLTGHCRTTDERLAILERLKTRRDGDSEERRNEVKQLETDRSRATNQKVASSSLAGRTNLRSR